MKPGIIILLAGSVFWAFLGTAAINAQVATNFDYEGAQLKSKNADSEEYSKPDGTRIFKYSGSEKAVLKDGTQIEKKNGRRMIVYPDGTRLSIEADGSRLYRYPDGRERSFSMTGKTPYGEDIKGEERRISNDGIDILIEYSAALSDDLLEGSSRAFFDELSAACKSRLTEKKPAGVKITKIVISTCRFCKTGYCSQKKSAETEVLLYKGGELLKKVSVPYSFLIKKENRTEYISKLLSEIFLR